MRYEQLGATGVFVSRIALGAMTFGGAGTPPWSLVGGLDEKAADELVGLALDAGVNLIDTADMYAAGECEEILGRVLRSRRQDVLLATKLFARMGAGPNDIGLSRLWVSRALEDSLRRLRTDHIDLYQIHSFDPLTPVEETLAALDDAVRQGKVRYIGASNLAAWQMMKYLGASQLRGWDRFVSQQVYYSLAGRDIEREILPMAVDQKLATLVWSPLAGGFLSGKFDRDGTADDTARRALADFPPVDRERGWDIVDALRVVAARHGVGVTRVALAWVLAQHGVTSVIVGAKRPDQLTENLAAVDLVLTDEDLGELDSASALPAPYPDWCQTAPADRLPLNS
ncbi:MULTISPECIES: aldo/keto reductase [Streptomyces]|uniref:Aldo/keto reductase n=1 Tax=Streptomyces chengmaiensis TaxID=3040919 RepID=A0ABT6HXY6_9ACTN|nr:MULTISPECIES: aldo/keto reductase [Streptomyces]MDH2393578.1 aldo/keto reductase [Streptomyces chengmaiensis]WRQ79297.1 aldo/keto reductase [Streptomyces sp. MUM 178J]